MANGATDLSSSFPERIPERVLAEQERIAEISTPRAVAPDAMLWLTLWCFRLMILGAAYLATQAGFSRKESVFGIPWQFEILAALVMLGAAYWAGSHALQKEPYPELLKTGAVKFVRVHSADKKILLPQVCFEFLDKEGKPLRVTRQNRSGIIFEGAYIPVFYRAENPEDCLPGCATSYKLVFPKN